MDAGTKRLLEWLSWGAILLLIFFDRYNKFLVLKREVLVLNNDGPLGIPVPRWLILLVTMLVLGYLIKEIVRFFSTGKRLIGISVVAIFIGGLSNLYDRFTYGGVIDYIEWFPPLLFNFADLLITLGLISVGLCLFGDTSHEKNNL